MGSGFTERVTFLWSPWDLSPLPLQPFLPVPGVVSGAVVRLGAHQDEPGRWHRTAQSR